MSNMRPETRRRILQASLKLLEGTGGKSVRISDVAKEAGVTRQTLYLYFKNRAELLISTTRYLDELKNAEARLHASRSAGSGVERLDAYITAWAGYLPEIHGVASALLAMNDKDASNAWSLRMQDMWEGCEAAIKALKGDDQMASGLSVREASDLLWVLLSIQNWESLRMDRKWSQKKYTSMMVRSAHRLLVNTPPG